MLVIDTSNILPALAASTVILVFILKVYLKVRTKFPIKVNCWFCNSHTKVPYVNHNSWYCPNCEQYNGFVKDGDYNRPMVEQYNSELNHRMWNAEVKLAAKQLNGLCRVCNINQELKVAQLAQFTPFDPNNFDYEVEEFSNKLERAYRLCPQCDVKLKVTLEKQRYLFKGLNIETAQKIVSSAIGTVQEGSKFSTVSTAIISACLFLCGISYFIANSWLNVYLKQTAEDISLALKIPEFLLYDGGMFATAVSWISAQMEWISEKLDVSVSTVLTGVCVLLQSVECVRQRNVSTALNVTSWLILFGLSMTAANYTTVVLIKVVEMSAAFVFFVLSTISFWTHGKHKPAVMLNKYSPKPQQPKPSQYVAAAKPERKTEMTTPKNLKIPEPTFYKPSPSVTAKSVISNDFFSSPAGKTCPLTPQGSRIPLHRTHDIEEEDFGFSGLKIGSKKEVFRNSDASSSFETKLYGAQIPVDLFRPKSLVLTPPKFNSTEKSFNLSSALSSTSNGPLTRSSSQSSGFGSMNQPVLESSRAPSVAGADFDSVSEPGGYGNSYHTPLPYQQQSLYPYHPFPSFHPSSLQYIHLAAAQYHQLYSAAAILDRTNESVYSSFRYSGGGDANSSYQNIRNTLYSPLIILLIISNLLLLTVFMYKEFVAVNSV